MPSGKKTDKVERLPTACTSLDKLLHGGIPSSQLTLVYGEAATAKTTFALQCALNCVRQGLRVIFVDADGTFPVERLKQAAPYDLESVAPRITVYTPRDLYEQTLLVEELRCFVSNDVGFLVVDTVNHLYRLANVEQSRVFILNKELNRQLAYLAYTAKAASIPVLLTSQVHSIFEAEDSQASRVEPVATRVLRFWSHNIICLCSTQRAGAKLALLERLGGRDLKSGLFCYFNITDRGLE